MNQANTAVVTNAAPAATHKHMPVLLGDGTRTSVSIPKELYREYVQRMGGDPLAFRTQLNEAAVSAKPRLGVTRSLAVRLALDERIAQMKQPV
ncbi:hypothetical protein SAMN05446935_0322 [Burkholderia sp. YR290]|nr:hypothetical protein SAMN05446935_0322 [Burkholderia sp. YR290]